MRKTEKEKKIKEKKKNHWQIYCYLNINIRAGKCLWEHMRSTSKRTTQTHANKHNTTTIQYATRAKTT